MSAKTLGLFLPLLDAAVRRFLPGYLRVRATSEDPKQLLIDQFDRETLTADRLSLIDRQRLLGVLRGVAQHMSTQLAAGGSAWCPIAGQLATLAAAERARIAQDQVLAPHGGVRQSARAIWSDCPTGSQDEDLTGRAREGVSYRPAPTPPRRLHS